MQKSDVCQQKSTLDRRFYISIIAEALQVF